MEDNNYEEKNEKKLKKEKINKAYDEYLKTGTRNKIIASWLVISLAILIYNIILGAYLDLRKYVIPHFVRRPLLLLAFIANEMAFYKYSKMVRKRQIIALSIIWTIYIILQLFVFK